MEEQSRQVLLTPTFWLSEAELHECSHNQANMFSNVVYSCDPTTKQPMNIR